MIQVNSSRTVNTAAKKMDAKVTGKIVVGHGTLSVGVTVHGRSDATPFYLQDNGPSLPTPTAVNLPHHLGILRGERFAVGMERSVKTSDLKGAPRL